MSQYTTVNVQQIPTRNDDGGPAYPTVDANRTADYGTYGMTLRDYFAGQALAALIACAENHGDLPHSKGALDAYQYADAMIDARKP